MSGTVTSTSFGPSHGPFIAATVAGPDMWFGLSRTVPRSPWPGFFEKAWARPWLHKAPVIGPSRRLVIAVSRSSNRCHQLPNKGQRWARPFAQQTVNRRSGKAINLDLSLGGPTPESPRTRKRRSEIGHYRRHWAVGHMSSISAEDSLPSGGAARRHPLPRASAHAIRQGYGKRLAALRRAEVFWHDSGARFWLGT